MSDDLDTLAEALQVFANHITDTPELIDNALILWESVSFDDDGDTQRCIRYAVPTPNFTMSGTLGLLEAGKYYLKRDILNADQDDDE